MKERLIRGFQRALGTDERESVELYVNKGQGALPGEVDLIAWSANRVHEYVFDTGNAIAIRGASHVLKDLDDRIGNKNPDLEPVLTIDRDQILYSGGGGGMAVIADGTGPVVAAQLHQAFAEATAVATCSVVSVPLSSFVDFREAKAQLFADLAQSRTLVGTDATVPVPFFCEPCNVCGRRAAAEAAPRGHGPSSQKRPECSVCKARIDLGNLHVTGEEESRDFDEIADPGGELAVIYVDGNGIGDLLARLASPLDYARFSAALKQCMGETLDSTLAAYGLVEEDEKAVKRFQVPIQGGDDLVLIVPGELAVPLARDLLHSFQDTTNGDPELRDISDQKLGASAGVAIGRLPIRHLLAEAEALLDSAKKRVYADKARSCLDFGVIADGQSRRSGTDAPRLERRKGKQAHSGLLFSGKPYDLEELERFNRRRGRFEHPTKGLAPSQMHACRRMAEAGPHQLRNHLLYQIGRHQGWRDLVRDLAESEKPLTDPDAAFTALVPEYGSHRVFDLADMIEMRGLWKEPGDLGSGEARS